MVPFFSIFFALRGLSFVFEDISGFHFIPRDQSSTECRLCWVRYSVEGDWESKKAGASLGGQWDPSTATKSDGTFDYI